MNVCSSIILLNSRHQICSFCSSVQDSAFRSRVATDTRAVQLMVPTTKPIADFHCQVITHAGRTTKSSLPISGKLLFYRERVHSTPLIEVCFLCRRLAFHSTGLIVTGISLSSSGLIISGCIHLIEYFLSFVLFRGPLQKPCQCALRIWVLGLA